MVVIQHADDSSWQVCQGKCKLEKPVSDFTFASNRYRVICKACVNAARRANYVANPEPYLEAGRKYNQKISAEKRALNPKPPVVPEGFKLCSVDNAVLPASEFYVKVKSTGQLFPWCKEHHKQRKHKYYEEHRDEVNAKAMEWARNNLEKRREIDKRYRQAHGDEIRAQERTAAAKPERKSAKAQYRLEHRDAHSAYNARYRATHVDEIKESNAAYRERVGGKTLSLRSIKSFAKKPAHYSLKRSEWKKSNKIKVNTYTNNRRARIKAIPGSYTVAQLEALYDKYDRTCLWCRRQEPDIKLSPDHVVAVTRQGATNYITNIQPLCAGVSGCNYKKGNRNFDFRPYWPNEVPVNPVFE